MFWQIKEEFYMGAFATWRQCFGGQVRAPLNPATFVGATTFAQISLQVDAPFRLCIVLICQFNFMPIFTENVKCVTGVAFRIVIRFS